jgi:hypothetical protein
MSSQVDLQLHTMLHVLPRKVCQVYQQECMCPRLAVSGAAFAFAASSSRRCCVPKRAHLRAALGCACSGAQAYIQIAIWGTSFCTSCWNVFGLLRKHLALISVVNGVAYLIVFIIKLGQTPATLSCPLLGAVGSFLCGTHLHALRRSTELHAGVCVGVAFMTYIWVRTKPEIEFYALIVCIVFLLSLVLVDAFTDVYEVCAEAHLSPLIDWFLRGCCRVPVLWWCSETVVSRRSALKPS